MKIRKNLNKEIFQKPEDACCVKTAGEGRHDKKTQRYSSSKDQRIFGAVKDTGRAEADATDDKRIEENTKIQYEKRIYVKRVRLEDIGCISLMNRGVNTLVIITRKTYWTRCLIDTAAFVICEPIDFFHQSVIMIMQNK